MMLNLLHYTIINVIKILIVSSIVFVWVVRYPNIVHEFKQYGLPDWFRDLMGILKLSTCIMLMTKQIDLILIATSTLTILMLAAFIVHLKFKHTIIQMLPSFLLMIASIFIGSYELYFYYIHH